MAKLIEVEKGVQVRIQSFNGTPAHQTKLNRLGIYPGDLARVIRLAPFGGPVLLEIRGMEIALGKSIASQILVEIDECASPS